MPSPWPWASDILKVHFPFQGVIKMTVLATENSSSSGSVPGSGSGRGPVRQGRLVFLMSDFKIRPPWFPLVTHYASGTCAFISICWQFCILSPCALWGLSSMNVTSIVASDGLCSVFTFFSRHSHLSRPRFCKQMHVSHEYNWKCFCMAPIQHTFVVSILCAKPTLSSKGNFFSIFIQKDAVLSFWFLLLEEVLKICVFLNHIAIWLDFHLDIEFGLRVAEVKLLILSVVLGLPLPTSQPQLPFCPLPFSGLVPFLCPGLVLGSVLGICREESLCLEDSSPVPRVSGSFLSSSLNSNVIQ